MMNQRPLDGKKGNKKPSALRSIPKWLSLAESLERELMEDGKTLLPSARSLEMKHRISRPTVLKAFAWLRERGLITVEPRRRALPQGMRRPSSPAAESAVAILRQQIHQGRHLSGTILPKLSVLSEMCETSVESMGTACRALSEEGYLTPKGRGWMVGCPDKRDRRKVILVLLNNPAAWNELATPRTQGFHNTLVSESERLDIQLIPVFTQQVSLSAWAPQGLDEIRGLAKRLGTALVGTIIPITRLRLTTLAEWCEALLRLDKPIVWFDRNDEGWGAGATYRRLYRCHFDESKAIEAGIRHLSFHGHRRILYPYAENQAWQYLRLRKLTECARRLSPRMELVPAINTIADFVRERDALPDSLEILLRLSTSRRVKTLRQFEIRHPTFRNQMEGRNAIQDFESLIHWLEENFPAPHQNRPPWETILWTPTMLKMMGMGKCTAALFPSQGLAEHVFNWLWLAGLEIPDRLSLLAFDNYSRYRFLPMDSIDFGFDHLGYWAVQVLLGLLPSKATRADIPARPRIISRGSMSGPGRPISETLADRFPVARIPPASRETDQPG